MLGIMSFKSRDSIQKYTISPECVLARENPQPQGIVDLLSESKIPRYNFLVDLKAQSTHCDKSRLDQMFE